MLPTNPLYWCPSCQCLFAPPRNAHPVDGVNPNCPNCGSIMHPSPQPLDNPGGTIVTLKIVGVVAQFLVASGVLEYLEERAKKTDSRLDDIALNFARALIEQAAKL